MFWSQVLLGNKISTIYSKNTKILHISNAVLVKHGNSDKVLIQLSDNNMRIMIASLIVNSNEFANLNINVLLKKGKEYKLSLVGGEGAEVHLSGFYNTPKASEHKKKNVSLRIRENAEETDATREKSFCEDKPTYSFNSEEIDEGVNNAEIEKFLKKKTNKEFDPPKKLEKLPQIPITQRPIYRKNF
jgi:hypothetical protein